MAKIIHVAANTQAEHEAMSLQHVRSNIDRTISVEVPYYDKLGGAQGVYLVMSVIEALDLAARLTTVVVNSMWMVESNPRVAKAADTSLEMKAP